MSRYRILKSVAHNFGASFLCLDHFDEKGYFVQALLETARRSGQPKLTIDLLKGKILPEEAGDKRMRKFAQNAPSWFKRILESQGCSMDMIKAANLQIEYNLSLPSPRVTEISQAYSFRDPWRAPECATYEAVISIVDDKERSHTSKIPPWWN